jgi:hypothetical protein
VKKESISVMCVKETILLAVLHVPSKQIDKDFINLAVLFEGLHEHGIRTICAK